MNNLGWGLGPDGQERLKLGLNGLFGDHADFGVSEPRGFNPIMQIVFAEPQPPVRIKLAGFFEFMGPQVEDDQPPAWLEDTKGFGQGFAGVFRVVQGLAEKSEVDTLVGEGDFFDVAKYIGQVPQVLLFCEGSPNGDHPCGVIDAVDAGGLPREEPGKRTIAGS